MNAATVSRAARPQTVVPGKVRSWPKWAALVGVLAAILIPGLLYWQEAPLRAAYRDAAAGDVVVAFSRVSYFLDRHPNHGAALALKGRLLVDLGRPKEALQIFDQVGAATAEDLHAFSRACLSLGMYSHAMPLLAQVLELEPSNTDVMYELAAVRIRLGLVDEAIPVAERLAKMPEQEGRAHVLLAIIHNDRGNYAQSAIEYEQVLHFSPDASGLQFPAGEVLSQYAGVLNALGQTEKAVGMLSRSVAVQPTGATYVALGSSLARLGRRDEALEAWKTAIELDPTQREAREALANEALQESQPEAALEWLKPLKNRSDLTASTAYLFQRAYQLHKDDEAAGKWKQTADQLRKSEQFSAQIEEIQMQSPRSFWGHVLRAYKFAKLGNWEQADVMLKSMEPEAASEPFVRDLMAAVGQRGELPSLDRLPFGKF